ncbi:SMP-30/gluconolactonase/LRE family protein [bacterium]|nr:MAG: SMP-30/gluconolactonase/LRE family protein [bacterium]
MTPELVVNEHCLCGENPLYDDALGVFYWCDIPPGKIFALDVKTGEHKLIYQDDKGREIGAFTLQEDGQLLILFWGEAGLLNPQTGELVMIKHDIVDANETGRFNDCLPDPHGRVVTGTVDWEKQVRGGLYQTGTTLDAQLIRTDTACSNGLAFTPDLKGLYWADSSGKTVNLFDYDVETGAITNGRVWLDTAPDLVPDGLTIDAEGCLWIAFYHGSCIRHYDPQANLIAEVKLPVEHVTSCGFGGENWDELYITSAAVEHNKPELEGGLFRLKLPVGGGKEFRSKVKIGA